jgi:hypothetical protein
MIKVNFNSKFVKNGSKHYFTMSLCDGFMLLRIFIAIWLHFLLWIFFSPYFLWLYQYYTSKDLSSSPILKCAYHYTFTFAFQKNNYKPLKIVTE